MRGADDEFVASYFVDPSPGGGGGGTQTGSDAPPGGPGIVSIPSLRQQYEQGDFSSAPPVPSQYDVGSAYSPQSAYEALLLNADPNAYVIPSGGAGPIAGQENLALAFRDPGSPSGIRLASYSAGAAQSPGLLTTATGLLGQPLTASVPWLTWGWALLIGLGLIIVMKKS